MRGNLRYGINNFRFNLMAKNKDKIDNEKNIFSKHLSYQQLENLQIKIYIKKQVFTS